MTVWNGSVNRKDTNMRYLKAALVSLGLLMGGCSAIAPKDPNEQSDWIRTNRDGSVERYSIITYERHGNVRPTPSAKGCGSFVMPDKPVMPEIPRVTARQAENSAEVENILIHHIADLRKYVRGYFDDLEKEYLAYRTQCEGQ